jgi:hypothetical protein
MYTKKSLKKNTYTNILKYSMKHKFIAIARCNNKNDCKCLLNGNDVNFCLIRFLSNISIAIKSEFSI